MKNNNVPELRFPEFQGDGAWEEKKFYDVASKKKWSFTGGPFGSNLKSSDFVVNGVRVIQLQNIGDGNFINEYKIYTTEEKANELLSCNIYPDDIILSKMGDPVGRACLIPNDHPRYVMCSDGIRLHVDVEKFVNYFIFSLINYKTFRALVDKTATGSTRKRIGLEDLKNLPVIVPTKPEQQKIADCLSSLDDVIHAQTQKIEKLTAHKKGLLQKLFPQEGQSVPEFRFPEFRECGAWEEKTLNEVFTLSAGGDVDKECFSASKDSEHPYPIYGNALTNEGLYGYSSRYKVPSEAITITGRGDIGKIFYREKFFTPIVRLVTGVAKEGFLTKFLSYACSKIRFSLETTGVPQLTVPQVKKYSTLVPLNKEEQQKIADCLSSLDSLILQHTKKLDALKKHKQGLMQGLFPC